MFMRWYSQMVILQYFGASMSNATATLKSPLQVTWGQAVRCRCRWWSGVSPGWRWVGPPACCSPGGHSPHLSTAWSPATDIEEKQTVIQLKLSCVIYKWNDVKLGSGKSNSSVPGWGCKNLFILPIDKVTWLTAGALLRLGLAQKLQVKSSVQKAKKLV